MTSGLPQKSESSDVTDVDLVPRPVWLRTPRPLSLQSGSPGLAMEPSGRWTLPLEVVLCVLYGAPGLGRLGHQLQGGGALSPGGSRRPRAEEGKRRGELPPRQILAGLFGFSFLPLKFLLFFFSF